MKFDTETAANYAAEKLDLFLSRAARDSTEVSGSGNIPDTATHFKEFRDRVDLLAGKMAALQAHVRTLSYEILPTMMDHQGIKTLILPELGRVTVNVRWSATVSKEAGMQAAMTWLRETGNGGLIIETINAGTLTSFAKIETLAGRPLPEHLFRVGTAQHISITKD